MVTHRHRMYSSNQCFSPLHFAARPESLPSNLAKEACSARCSAELLNPSSAPTTSPTEPTAGSSVTLPGFAETCFCCMTADGFVTSRDAAPAAFGRCCWFVRRLPTGLDAAEEDLGCCGCLKAVSAARSLDNAWLLPRVLLQGLTGGAVLPLAGAGCLGETLPLAGGVRILVLIPCFSICVTDCASALGLLGCAELPGALALGFALTLFTLSAGLQTLLDLGWGVTKLHKPVSGWCKPLNGVGSAAVLLLQSCRSADSASGASARAGLNAGPAGLEPSAWRAPGVATSAALPAAYDKSLTACLLLVAAPVLMLAEPALCRLTELDSCTMLPALLLTDRLEPARVTCPASLDAAFAAEAVAVFLLSTPASEATSTATLLHELASLASVDA